MISAFDHQDRWFDPEQWAATGQRPRTYCRAAAGVPVKGPGGTINLTCMSCVGVGGNPRQHTLQELLVGRQMVLSAVPSC